MTLVDCPPEGLTITDLTAILDQVMDPDTCYRVEGWILRALADELLAWKSGRMGTGRRKARAHPRPLFEEEDRS